jgi:hypothetical protein
MKYLVEIAKAVAEGVSREETRSAIQADRAAVTQEVVGLIDEDVLLLAKTLFGVEPKVDRTFYDTLAEFQHHIGYEVAHHALVGRMWAIAFAKLPQNKGSELLSALLSDNLRGFWPAIRCLPQFCAKVELPPAFAAKWFHDLGARVQEDLAGGDFYDAVCRYAERFP